MRYDASSDRYVFDLPAHEPAGFYTAGNTPSDSYWSGGLSAGQQPTEVWPPMSVLKPTNPGLPLTYTSFATYYQAGPFEDLPHGYVAFGFATPVGAVPVNGSATYTAIAAGASETVTCTSGDRRRSSSTSPKARSTASSGRVGGLGRWLDSAWHLRFREHGLQCRKHELLWWHAACV